MATCSQQDNLTADEPPEEPEDATQTAEPHVIAEEILEKFKSAYQRFPGGKYRLDVQVTYLIHLADGYFDKLKRTRHWKDALKAHALYNSVGVRCEDDPMWREKAFMVQKEYWKNDVEMNEQESHEITRKLAKMLKNIRAITDAQLNSKEFPLAKILRKVQSGKGDQPQVKQDFFNEMQKVSTECTDGMVSVCKVLFDECLTVLRNSKLPCSFCVVGIGSLAKGEATPYSDLEYIFFIEKEGEEAKRFFHMLAMTSYFFIGNLRETPLDAMAITELGDWFSDKQKCGFHIDGLEEMAGNIPTGNGLTDTTFILTPEALADRFKYILDNPDQTTSIRGDLTAMLQYTIELFSCTTGGEKLLAEFLKERDMCSPNDSRKDANQQMFEEDAKWYNFKPSYELINKGYLVNAKKELYRYPSILLNNIAIVAGFHHSDSWETLSRLKEHNVISTSIYQSVSFLLACTCYFRLAAYLFHNSHDDRLSALGNTKDLGIHRSNRHPASLQAGKRWFIPQGLFVQHCEVAIPLKNHIAQCESVPTMELLRMKIKQPTWLVQFQIQHYSHRWLGAWNLFEEKLGKNVLETNPQDILSEIHAEVHSDVENLWFCIKALTYVLYQQREYEVAVKYLNSFLTEVESLLDAALNGRKTKHGEPCDVVRSSNDREETDDTLELIKADILEELGTGHIYLDRHSEAEVFYNQTLNIRSGILPKSNNKKIFSCIEEGFMSATPALIAKTQLLLGRCLRLMFRFSEAEEVLVEAMRVFNSLASKEPKYDYYGRELSQAEIADLLETVTSPDRIVGYLNNSSVMLGRVIWNLGNIYFYRKFYKRAYDYFHAAKRMYDEAYGDDACHKDIGEGLITLAMVYDSLGRHKEADDYYHDCMLVTTQLFRPELVTGIKLVRPLLLLNKVTAHIYYEKLVNTVLSLPGYKVEHVETARVAQMFGIHLIHAGHPKLAQWLLGTIVIQMYMRTDRYKPKDIEIAKNTSLVAINYWKQGKVQEACDHFSHALDMMDALDSSEYVDLEAAETLQAMAQMFLEQGEPFKVKENLQLSHDRYSKWCAEDHPKMLETKLGLEQAKVLTDLEIHRAVGKTLVTATEEQSSSQHQ